MDKVNEKATIFDYARLCASFEKCNQCVLHKFCADQRNMFSNDIDKANEIILKWCEEHPTKTRQSELLKMFPSAKIDNCGTPILCPQWVDKDFKCNLQTLCCDECCREYWFAEVDENE